MGMPQITLPIGKLRRKQGKFNSTIVCPILYAHNLSMEELKEFDYLIEGDPSIEESWYNCDSLFFRYRNELYDMGEFDRIVHPGQNEFKPFCHFDHGNTLRNWDRILTDSFFSGIVIKYLNDETIRAAFYCS